MRSAFTLTARTRAKTCSDCLNQLRPPATALSRRHGPRCAALADSSIVTVRALGCPRWLSLFAPRSCTGLKPGRRQPSGRWTRRCRSVTFSNCKCSNSRRIGVPELNRDGDNAMLTELGQRLISGSLSDAMIQKATEDTPTYPILPWVNVVKIGGQSIMDRGRSAVGPLVDEIVANLHRHKMILGTGAGTRARHVYSVAIDLGLPVGVLTVLGTAVAWQNAQLLQYLLAQHGIAFLEPEGFPSLPHYLMERGAVICQGMPPYKLWESNPSLGQIPPERTDTGCFLIAEVFGARKMIYVKDEDGL